MVGKTKGGQFLLLMKQSAIKKRIRNKLQMQRRTFPKFLVNGSINACIVIAIMAACDGIFNNVYITNISGYIAGFLFGLFVHSRYTFGTPISLQNSFAYSLIIISGYLINLLVLSTLIASVPAVVAQLSSITVYICYSFIMQSAFLRKQNG